MKYLKTYNIHQINEGYESLKLDDDQLVLVIKNENDTFNIVKKIHKFTLGDDDLYQKGDVLMYIGDIPDSQTNVDYMYFRVTRGHGHGKYANNNDIRLKSLDFAKYINKVFLN